MFRQKRRIFLSGGRRQNLVGIFFADFITHQIFVVTLSCIFPLYALMYRTKHILPGFDFAQSICICESIDDLCYTADIQCTGITQRQVPSILYN